MIIGSDSPDHRRQVVREEFDREARIYGQSRAVHRGYLLQRDHTLRLVGTGHRRILDLGCGTGDTLRAACPTGTSGVGVDLSLQMLAHAQLRVQEPKLLFVAADACSLPVASGTFDAVISVGLMEYIWPDPRAPREMARVLRQGGIAVIAFPHKQCLARRVGESVRIAYQGARSVFGVNKTIVRTIDRPRAADFDRAMAACGFERDTALFCYPQLLDWPLREMLPLVDVDWGVRLDPILGRSRWFGRIYVSRWRLA